MQKLTKILILIVGFILAFGGTVLIWSSGWLFSRWGQGGIYDLAFLVIIIALAIGVVAYSIINFKLYFPPVKPLLLVCFSYWLTAMAFSGLYGFIYKLDPNSFSGALNGTNWDFAYFSFVTITTLGYGEIQPVSFVARWLSVFEACVGLFYVAVLIAIVLQGKPEHHR